MLWSISGGVIIFVLGMFIFLKPDLVWKLTEAWKSYRADEPSELYLKTTKIGGILFALLGVVMIILVLFVFGRMIHSLLLIMNQVTLAPLLIGGERK